MNRVTILLLILLAAAVPAIGEIKVIPNPPGVSSSMPPVQATGGNVPVSMPVSGQGGGGGFQPILDSHTGKPFGTIRKTNRGEKKQQSSRALFRKNANDATKWY